VQIHVYKIGNYIFVLLSFACISNYKIEYQSFSVTVVYFYVAVTGAYMYVNCFTLFDSM